MIPLEVPPFTGTKIKTQKWWAERPSGLILKFYIILFSLRGQLEKKLIPTKKVLCSVVSIF